MRTCKGYRDADGRVFVVADGISKGDSWGVFEVRPRTGSLRRVKSIPMTTNRQTMVEMLDVWAAHKHMTPVTVER